MIIVVLCLFACVYYVFWAFLLPYQHSVYWRWHGVLGSELWFNMTWHYILTVLTKPGAVDVAREGTTFAQRCTVCARFVVDLDHHCPLTGGCIGRDNFRFFAVFLFHCIVGLGYICALAWRPYQDCVLHYDDGPSFAAASADENAPLCDDLGSHAHILELAAPCFVGLCLLGLLHLLLAMNGQTTIQFNREWRVHGLVALRKLLTLRGAARYDKWAMLWGRPAAEAGMLHRLRVLTLPAAPTPNVVCALRSAGCCRARRAKEDALPLERV